MADNVHALAAPFILQVKVMIDLLSNPGVTAA
jgi:hypothetical protein